MPESTAISVTHRPAWKALQAHYNQIHSRHLKELFAEDPKRAASAWSSRPPACTSTTPSIA